MDFKIESGRNKQTQSTVSVAYFTTNWPDQLRAYLAFDTPARGRGEAVLERRPPSSAPLTPPSPASVHQQARPSLILLVMIGAGLRRLLASGRGSLAAATPGGGRPSDTLLVLPRHNQPRQRPVCAVVYPRAGHTSLERERVGLVLRLLKNSG